MRAPRAEPLQIHIVESGRSGDEHTQLLMLIRESRLQGAGPRRPAYTRYLFHPQSALTPVKFSPRTAIAVVIANMIGAGVFTSLGFQLLEFRSGFVLIMLWVVGGVTALCGALSYAELGAALPRSGGEYNFLSRIYHPGAGFAAGWISATIGFAAPIALVALTFGAYLEAAVPWLERTWLAFGLIALLTFAHSTTRERSGQTQRWFTSLKIILIIAFCLAGWLLAPELQQPAFAPNVGDVELITSGAFAVALIYVNYAYTGWNAATYLTGELEDPQRSLSRVLILGTLAVTLLYLLLNGTFLLLAPMDAMAGHEEIGHIAASHAFGTIGGNIMGTVLALLFVSTASAMLMAGPRTLQCIGQDFPLFRLGAHQPGRGSQHRDLRPRGPVPHLCDERISRKDPRVRRVHAWRVKLSHGAGRIRASSQGTRTRTALQNSLVPSAAACISAGHRMDACLHRLAATNGGLVGNGDHRCRRGLVFP